MDYLSITHAVSTFVLAVLAFGLYHRHNTPIHVPCMSFAFATDLVLVLYIEFNLQAVENVVESARTPEENALLLFHAAISLVTVILYGVLTWLGYKVLKGDRSRLTLHGQLAKFFIVTRLINYVTSFML